MTMIPEGYTSSEVGIIPVNWKVGTLGEGNARFTKGYGISKADLSEGGIPCVRYAELYTTYGDMCVLTTPASTTLPASAKKFAQKGDVIFACSGETFEDIGRAIAYIGDSPIAVGGDTLIYSNHNFEPSFLGYLLNSRYVVRQKMANSVGTTIIHIREKQLAELVVAYPEYEEQRAIATALSDVDALIEAKQALLEKKRAIKPGAMQELLTGKRRLPGFPVTSMKNTEIGEIPEDWEVKPLGEIGVVKMCKRIFKHETSAEGDIPFFKIGTFGQQADAYISKEKFDAYKSLYPYPQKGTPLISAAGTIGRVVVYDGQDAYYQDSNIVWLEHEEKDILHAFLRYYYSVINWVTETGSAITRLYNNNILSSQVALPTLREQSAIASTLADMDLEVTALEQELKKLVTLKQGMMQELLTGSIRLV